MGIFKRIFRPQSVLPIEGPYDEVESRLAYAGDLTLDMTAFPAQEFEAYVSKTGHALSLGLSQNFNLYNCDCQHAAHVAEPAFIEAQNKLKTWLEANLPNNFHERVVHADYHLRPLRYRPNYPRKSRPFFFHTESMLINRRKLCLSFGGGGAVGPQIEVVQGNLNVPQSYEPLDRRPGVIERMDQVGHIALNPDDPRYLGAELLPAQRQRWLVTDRGTWFRYQTPLEPCLEHLVIVEYEAPKSEALQSE